MPQASRPCTAPSENPLKTGGVKIDIYAPRKVADLVVVHDLAILKMHSRCFLERRVLCGFWGCFSYLNDKKNGSFNVRKRPHDFPYLRRTG